MECPDVRYWEHPVLRWNTKKCHRSYRIDESGFVARVDCSQVEYFSSAIAEKAFEPGKRYYFELVIKTESPSSSSVQVKCGVTTDTSMEYGYGFSDKTAGWSYYLYESGYKRHNSHTQDSGCDYGSGYKVGQTLGVFVDLVAGYVAFSVDGTYYGRCYSFPELPLDKPLYAAVAMNNSDHNVEFVRKAPTCWDRRAPALFIKKYVQGFCLLNRVKQGLSREIMNLI